MAAGNLVALSVASTIGVAFASFVRATAPRTRASRSSAPCSAVFPSPTMRTSSSSDRRLVDTESASAPVETVDFCPCASVTSTETGESEPETSTAASASTGLRSASSGTPADLIASFASTGAVTRRFGSFPSPAIEAKASAAICASIEPVARATRCFPSSTTSTVTDPRVFGNAMATFACAASRSRSSTVQSPAPPSMPE